MVLSTPYYLIDEKKLLRNLKRIKYIKQQCAAKIVLALKCFSCWSVFGLMRKYLDGTTSSSVYEARLGFEKFGKEVQAYCVAFSKQEVREVSKFAHKIIFNSVSQLERFYSYAKSCQVGLRINPGVSFSQFDLADPARKFSRLGARDKTQIKKIMPLINGVMFHFNCENDDFNNLCCHIDFISRRYADLFLNLDWVSFGGGIYFSREDYPLKKFCKKLDEFSRRFKVQVYLEPGESVVSESAELVTKVLDIVHNRMDIAIVDASVEAHMLDLLVYRESAKIKGLDKGRFKYIIAGRSCLAADVFGTANFKNPLRVGSTIRICDAAGYTMVKKNWFNGLRMPAIVLKKLNGSLKIVRQFNYRDFESSLS